MKKHHVLWIFTIIAIVIAVVALILVLQKTEAQVLIDTPATCIQNCNDQADLCLDSCLTFGGTQGECHQTCANFRTECIDMCTLMGGGGGDHPADCTCVDPKGPNQIGKINCIHNYDRPDGICPCFNQGTEDSADPDCSSNIIILQ